MTERKLLTLDDFVTEPATTTRFGEKVTRNPIEQIYNAGLLSDYKKLAISHKYIKFTGMFEEGDGAEGWYIRDESITDEEDIGVIIYIGQHKYRRLFGAYVLVDWFYTGDFSIALQRACKYASVRCIPGKEYNCTSSITLKLNIRTAATEHGSIDYGHVLIDLRGATINYTAENTSYCFNIRLYHRDTKFMLTNGNFIVSENAKVSLKNIANIIGGNNYTDMLTDMHYNVDKALLPDTNRVVLFSEPIIEGIKTFERAFNYVGDSNSAENNQAVTKEYMPEAINEEAYIALEDTRKIEGVLAFNQIVDRLGNNLVGESEVSNIVLEAAKTTLEGLMNSADISIYLPFMYYTKHIQAESPVKILGGNWEEQLLLSTDEYNVFKQQQSNYIITPQRSMLITENEIGIPVYIKLYLNKPITVDDTTVEVECDSVKALIKANINKVAIDTNIAVGDSQTVYKLKFVPEQLSPVFNGRTPAYAYIGRSYGVFTYTDNTTDIIYFPVIEGYHIIGYDAIYYNGHLCRVDVDYSVSMRVTINNVVRPDINMIQCDDLKITKFNGLNLINVNLQGSEYVVLEPATYYLKEYTKLDGNITFNSFYIKCLVPIQANLNAVNTKGAVKPCARLNFVFEYNKEIINTSYIDIYINRFIANGVPNYEIPDLENYDKDKFNNNRVPSIFPYTNNTLCKLKYLIPTVCGAVWYEFLYYKNNIKVGVKDNSSKYCYNRSDSVVIGITNTIYCSGTIKHLLTNAVYKLKNASVRADPQYALATSFTSGEDIVEADSGYSKYYPGLIMIAPTAISNITTGGLIGYIEVDSGNIQYIYFGGYHSNAGSTYLWGRTFYSNTAPTLTTYDDNKIYTSSYSYDSSHGICTFTDRRGYSNSGQLFCDMSLSIFVAYPNLYRRLFGQLDVFNIWVINNTSNANIRLLRDGVLKDPFRERTLMPEHAKAIPIFVYTK